MIGRTRDPSPRAAATSTRSAPKRGEEPELGILLISSRPWARVWIDGHDTGRNTPVPPGAPLKLSEGRHVVTLYTSEKKYDFPVVMKAGRVTKLIKTLPEAKTAP